MPARSSGILFALCMYVTAVFGTVVGISIDEQPAAYVRGFAHQAGLNYTILLDPEMHTPEAFYLKGIPTLFVLDQKQNIVLVKEGVEFEEKAEIMETISNLVRIQAGSAEKKAANK